MSPSSYASCSHTVLSLRLLATRVRYSNTIVLFSLRTWTYGFSPLALGTITSSAPAAAHNTLHTDAIRLDPSSQGRPKKPRGATKAEQGTKKSSRRKDWADIVSENGGHQQKGEKQGVLMMYDMWLDGKN